MSRLARALWIEIMLPGSGEARKMSRLARALWIEIIGFPLRRKACIVVARESLVD